MNRRELVAFTTSGRVIAATVRMLFDWLVVATSAMVIGNSPVLGDRPEAGDPFLVVS
jgi:hypothetical protein